MNRKPSLPSHILRKITQAIDKATIKYQNDENIIFDNECNSWWLFSGPGNMSHDST